MGRIRNKPSVTRVRATDMKTNVVIYEGDIDGACFYLDIERHNIYNYIKRGKLYKEQYFIQKIDGRTTKPLKLTEEQEKEICKLYEECGSMNRCHETFSITTHAVEVILIKHGLKEPKITVWQAKPKDKIDYGKVGALFKANWSIPKIADEFSTNNAIIIEILQELELHRESENIH